MISSSRRAFLGGMAKALPTSWVAFQQQLQAADTTEDYWRLVKRQFPLAEGLIYLNAANVCPASRLVLDRHQEFLRDFQADPSFQNRDKYESRRESLRAKLATLLGAEADEIAITRNTSEGSNTIVNGVDLREGDEILITAHNHPSSNHSWKQRAKRHRLVVKEARVPVPAASAQQLIDSFEKEITPRTRVMVATHVTNTTGNRYPVAELARLATRHKAWFHVDGAQTFGALRVNLREIGCDSYSGSAHKWLMGPLEAGVLFVRKERVAQLWPSLVTAGWDDNLKGARKFEVFGQRDDPRLVGFEAAVDFINTIGMANVEERLKAIATRLKHNLSSTGGVEIKTPMDWELSGGVVKFQVKGKNTAALYDALYRQHRVALAHTASGDAAGLRYSPHVYNSMGEMDEAAGLIRRLS